MPVLMHCWGDAACFTRPEMKAERVSYDVITPSAARGMLDSIYRHPGMTWIIDKIYVCKPIKFGTMRRNEIKSKPNALGLFSAIANRSELPTCNPSTDRTQRSTMYLKDVEYVIEAHFIITNPAVTTKEKVAAIAFGNIEHGKWYHPPYFGCREFSAHFELVDKVPNHLTETKDLGWMLCDMDYSNPRNPRPLFFRAMMENGCIKVPRRRDVI